MSDDTLIDKMLDDAGAIAIADPKTGNFGPDVLTEMDVRKARRSARRHYREELQDAVREELQKTPLNANTLVQATYDLIVKDVVVRVERSLEQKGTIEKIVDEALGKMIKQQLQQMGSPTLREFVVNAAKIRAAEVVNKAFIIQLAEDSI